jgi:hypothetical protein
MSQMRADETFSRNNNHHYRHDIPRLKHLKKYKLLENKLIIVQINNESQFKIIHQFLNNYGDSSLTEGLFLVLSTKKINAVSTHYLLLVDSENFINEFLSSTLILINNLPFG